MDATLQGLWAFRRSIEAGEEEIMRVFADGRIVQFYKQHPSLTKHVGMTLRAALEGDEVFRVRTDPAAEGYLITMRRDGANLIIVNGGRTFLYRPLGEEERPSWLGEVSAEAVWK